MLEVEVFGAELAPDAPSPAEVRRLCAMAAAAAGVEDGHLAIEYVGERRISQLNIEHRGKTGPTDVLSFPIDGAAPIAGTTVVADDTAHGDLVQRGDIAPHDGAAEHDGAERELGDVVICPAHTVDLRETIVHGVLHLVGFDHETDNGEMLALQAELLADRSSSGSPLMGEDR